MSQLCSAQKLLSERIAKLYSNTKKSKSRYTRGYLETRLETLTEYWATYNRQHDEILKTVSSDILEQIKFDPTANFDVTEETYLEFKTAIKEYLIGLSPQESHKSSTAATCPDEVIESEAYRTKLPPLNIPRFSGDYLNFSSYRDIFTSLIHNNSKLSKIEKHHYLKSSISGEAEQLLKHFTLNAANYDKAWETLENRYDNKRIIVNHILNRLLNQRKMTNECAQALKGILDTTRECLSSLENLAIETNKWDAIIIHIVVSKLDVETHKLWEQSLGSSRDIPTFDTLASYLESRFRAMEAVHSSKRDTQRRDSTKPTSNPARVTSIKTFTAEIGRTCTFCSQNHYICHCKEFSTLDITQRHDFVKKNNICFNCLVKGHSVNQCKQSTSCKKCGRRHHTLLHFTNPTRTSTTSEQNQTEIHEAVTMKAETNNTQQVILATARIVVIAKNGATHQFRALIDPGSQASFVTETTAQLLHLDRISVNGKITGISDEKVITTKSMVNLEFHSIYDSSHIITTQAFVLKRLTSLLPSHEVSMDSWPLLSTMKLADPQFHKPGCIDILLGAEVHSQLMIEGLHKHNAMIALNSHLGWLISGQIRNGNSLSSHHVVVSHCKLEIDQLLRRFWELEEHTHNKRQFTQLEAQCEEHYKETHTRNADGRYIVRLPFKTETALGDTKGLALNRLTQMEKRFKHKPEFKDEYCKFLRQYETQGHMEAVPERERNTNYKYYLPHHAVLKESSTTTKLRVVFDGSAASSTGRSINDELMIGPPLQQDIRDLVTRWRTHRICLVADIQQMYRQILIDRRDTDYQRILWRENSNEAILEYRLLTVTYGTSCAPYLAIRTLHQLSDDEKKEFPIAAPLLKTDFYMDDLMSGTSNEDDTIRLQLQITELLRRGGFLLHKWSSNSAQVLSQIPNANKTNQTIVNIQINDAIKALGIAWNPDSDNFELKMSIDPLVNPITKRTVLSIIAKTFDPLGWLAPVVIILKIFMQRLWLAGLDWDDVLPGNLRDEWCGFHDNIKHVNIIQLPRWLGLLPSKGNVEIHGFCDASATAYACVVYLRVLDDNVVKMRLIAAKSKVAPVKQVSLPRLELCGAVLLAKMLFDIRTSIPIEQENMYAWTDSTIVLAWLRKHPSSWSTFVANRTTEILNVTNSSQWHHVKSGDNPADLASRGTSPNGLKESTLWWEGPPFLRTSEVAYSNDILLDTVLEAKSKLASHVTTNNIYHGDSDSLLNRYSSYTKLIRVTAYCLRFVQRCKDKVSKTTTNWTSYLSTNELLNAYKVCIRLSQHVTFQYEIELLLQGKPSPKSSKLFPLHPFIDDHNILRVGGRLINAQCNMDLKFPVILSNQCHLTKLIVIDAHHKTLHGGFQLTLNLLNLKYCIIGAKRLVKSIIRKCVPCFRQRATPRPPFMGNLPSHRVQRARPFLSSGVDFAGPFSLKLYSGRCNRTRKAYISLFVCTVTKAIHLELVEDMSTMAFMAAFKRFTARRGHCKDIYSDCGTNFQGASREMAILFHHSKFNLVDEISELLANDHTTWHFIPPSAPHFGGLWEAGVKSVKGHLKRVIGPSCLTFNEFYTLLTQVEACVNSRPLTLIDSSLSEPPLTPGHFLIGEPPIVVPDKNVETVRTTHLNRWQLVQRMLQSLWRRWQEEYLTTLQYRYKWNKQQLDIELGTIVLIKDERLPPGKWLLGRVLEKHPGKDGVTRVVTIKLKDHVVKRPVTKLCPLPIEMEIP